MQTSTRRTIVKASMKGLGAAVALRLGASRRARAQTSRWYEEPRPVVKGRYLAVDNVCAYPNMTRLDDGTLIVAIYNQPTHGGPNGDIECWASEDGGRFWKLRGIAAPHEPDLTHLQACIGTAHDGSLLVLAETERYRDSRLREGGSRSACVDPRTMAEPGNGRKRSILPRVLRTCSPMEISSRVRGKL